jgi:hypothetical protein
LSSGSSSLFLIFCGSDKAGLDCESCICILQIEWKLKFVFVSVLKRFKNDILTVRKDKLSPVLASPGFFIINYFLFKWFYDLLNPSSAPLEHQTNAKTRQPYIEN